MKYLTIKQKTNSTFVIEGFDGRRRSLPLIQKLIQEEFEEQYILGKLVMSHGPEFAIAFGPFGYRIGNLFENYELSEQPETFYVSHSAAPKLFQTIEARSPILAASEFVNQIPGAEFFKRVFPILVVPHDDEIDPIHAEPIQVSIDDINDFVSPGMVAAINKKMKEARAGQ